MSRSSLLFPLFSSVTSVRGVGEKTAKTLERVGITRVIDMVLHMPAGIVDRRANPPLPLAKQGQVITVRVRVDEHIPSPPYGRKPYRVVCHNESGYIDLVFFQSRADYLKKLLPEGEERIISGHVERFADTLQMPHPDYILPLARASEAQRVEPVYPLTQGVSLKQMGKYMREALKMVPALPEWQDESYIKRRHFPSFKDAVLAAHTPETEEDILPSATARRRLAFDELLASQLALGLVRARTKKLRGVVNKGKGQFTKALLGSLPFVLTKGQQQVVKEIEKDLHSPERMLRLLQGDVGSGKTVVSLLAMLNVAEAGRQSALMAPTEILARQHYRNIHSMVEEAGLADKVVVEILTGKDKGKRRKEVLEKAAAGKIAILIGTHALFQEGVVLKALGLVVVDEQHRFGVRQRLELSQKGDGCDVLLMTATPIPRTLTMTYYGDMDVSILREKPPGRTPIDTRIAPNSRMEEIIARMAAALAAGSKAYWICPLVEESEKSDLAAATERYDAFCKIYGKESVGLVHGRMKPQEKEKQMEAFAMGKVRLLVATTVIEVGVDVPDATIMVIEHAERFGLAQLHQLRGRVGRGKAKSSCLLLYAEPLSETGRARLGIMRETEDGFKIAEEDLVLRGSGEVLGTRQSGLPGFKLADVMVHRELLLAARDDARYVLEKDPSLSSKRGLALRNLLHLFEYDKQVEYIFSG